MTGNEIRETFLRYFEQRGHTRVRSSPLLPANDPTLLFTNAGMNQFKDVFLGLEKREYVRACSSQKCVRAGGKHNDLDEVGKTARHQTFFEMLGNFSFGDYFKREAVEYAWDFLTGSRDKGKLGLDPERLWFTIFGGDEEVPADEEAAALWVEMGAKPERVLRFDRKDNFWQMAETGPCGPNSEINYYLGEHPEDPEFNRADLVNGPGDTTMEIWNLVFMQYNRIEVEPGKYKLEPLPKPSVDTGMGLERTAAILQGKFSNYDTDLLHPIIEFTANLARRDYEPETQEGFAMRVIADHARATAFLIADGILPGNEGRNYVLRKIMRRAIYQGRHTLGFQDSFFHKVTNFVVDQMHEPFPELEVQRDFIEKMVKLEEERFGATMTVGLQKLDDLFAQTPKDQTPAYTELARLYDTFGTPRDLIRVGLEERGFTVDEDQFNHSFDEALKSLQQTGKLEIGTSGPKTNREHSRLVNNPLYRSKFRGYEETTTHPVRVMAIVKEDTQISELKAGEHGEIVLDRTPFYAEAGGQVGDTGQLTSDDGGIHAVVTDTVSPVGGLVLHKVTVDSGTIKAYPPPDIGVPPLPDDRPRQFFRAEVDVEKRDATRRNHTTTHLMHAALREVLGTHVKQAGSVVAPNYLRFDFSHYQPLTRSEVEEIENLVNYHILRNEPVETNEMAVEEAMRSGAMALFGEKYGEKVRVLSIKGAEDIFSKELCGGTHVRATGDIGLFKIVSDESIASGVRRIRALTGVEAFARFREAEAIVEKVAGGLRTARTEVPVQVERLQEELKRARREADELRLKLASRAVNTSANGDESREVAGVRVVAREASGLDAAGMRQLSDTLLARIKSGVVVLGRTGDGKVSLIVRTSPDLLKRVPAGQVIKELAPIVGGKGGGKPDMAEGGGNLPEKLTEALEASYQVVERLLA
ncbi:MAG: alanine--tRNA ligase [Pyrinomonadaceae bacterium]